LRLYDVWETYSYTNTQILDFSCTYCIPFIMYIYLLFFFIFSYFSLFSFLFYYKFIIIFLYCFLYYFSFKMLYVENFFYIKCFQHLRRLYPRVCDKWRYLASFFCIRLDRCSIDRNYQQCYFTERERKRNVIDLFFVGLYAIKTRSRSAWVKNREKPDRGKYLSRLHGVATRRPRGRVQRGAAWRPCKDSNLFNVFQLANF